MRVFVAGFPELMHALHELRIFLGTTFCEKRDKALPYAWLRKERVDFVSLGCFRRHSTKLNKKRRQYFVAYLTATIFYLFHHVLW